MGLAVALQHNSKRDLRGCIIMQSTTWPWRAGVFCCHQSNALCRYRIATVRGKLFAIGCSSIATSAGTSFSSVATSPSILFCPLCHRALPIRTTGISQTEQVTMTQTRPVDRGLDCIPLFVLPLLQLIALKNSSDLVIKSRFDNDPMKI